MTRRNSTFIFPALFFLFTLTVLAQPETQSVDDIPPLRPPHAEIPPTFWEHYGVWIAILGAALLALLIMAIWLLTRPKAPAEILPEVQAREALQLLSEQPQDGQMLSQVS